MQPDFYAILGVARHASSDQIRAAHRRMAKQVHPDVADGDEERFRLVRLAYETLIDPDRRASYDSSRPTRVPRPRQSPRAEQTGAGDSQSSGRYRKRYSGSRRPIRDWQPGPCWQCGWRDGRPSLQIRLEKHGAQTHIVSVPHCATCKPPIPSLPMATADFVVFTTVLASAVVAVAMGLVVGVAGLPVGGQVAFWASCVAVLAGTAPMVVDFRRRIPSGYRRRATILVDYVADYPAIARLLDKGYLIVT